jgi:hypothetical protein
MKPRYRPQRFWIAGGSNWWMLVSPQRWWHIGPLRPAKVLVTPNAPNAICGQAWPWWDPWK